MPIHQSDTTSFVCRDGIVRYIYKQGKYKHVGGIEIETKEKLERYLQSTSPVGTRPSEKSFSETQSKMLSKVFVSLSKSEKL